MTAVDTDAKTITVLVHRGSRLVKDYLGEELLITTVERTRFLRYAEPKCEVIGLEDVEDGARVGIRGYMVEDDFVAKLVVVDIPDNLRNVSISIALWENDTVESAGLNADDHLDVDGTSDDLDCDIVYDLLAAVWKGDTATGETDGHADGLPPESEHPDALLRFAIEVVAAG